MVVMTNQYLSPRLTEIFRFVKNKSWVGPPFPFLPHPQVIGYSYIAIDIYTHTLKIFFYNKMVCPSNKNKKKFMDTHFLFPFFFNRIIELFFKNNLTIRIYSLSWTNRQIYSMFNYNLHFKALSVMKIFLLSFSLLLFSIRSQYFPDPGLPPSERKDAANSRNPVVKTKKSSVTTVFLATCMHVLRSFL